MNRNYPILNINASHIDNSIDDNTDEPPLYLQSSKNKMAHIAADLPDNPVCQPGLTCHIANVADAIVHALMPSRMALTNGTPSPTNNTSETRTHKDTQHLADGTNGAMLITLPPSLPPLNPSRTSILMKRSSEQGPRWTNSTNKVRQK